MKTALIFLVGLLFLNGCVPTLSKKDFIWTCILPTSSDLSSTIYRNDSILYYCAKNVYYIDSASFKIIDKSLVKPITSEVIRFMGIDSLSNRKKLNEKEERFLTFLNRNYKYKLP